MPRPIKFQSGRKDCVDFGERPFIATKHESHPNSVGNGQQTVDFFVKNFGFNGRETVAIMGTHTLGQPNVENSLFRYKWVAKGEALFNNDYYK